MEGLTRFARLFHPVAVDEFLASYYEKRPLHVRRDRADHYGDLVNANDVDRLFETSAIAKSVLRVNKDGRDVPPDRYSKPDVPAVSNRHLFELFATGHTLILNNADQVFPNLDRYTRELERELLFRVQPNIYITPFDARAFATHYDDHDVFILQVMGSKNWRLFHAPVELPSRRQPCVPGADPVGVPELEVTLCVGDCLYIPRGVLHDASTSGASSAHVTLGMHPPYRFSLVEELVHVAQGVPELRKAIPIGLLRHEERASLEAEAKRLLRDLIDTVDVGQLLDRLNASFVSQRRVSTRSRFRDLTDLNQVNPATIVRRRSDVLCLLERDSRSITAVFSGHRIPVQPFLAEALECLLQDDPVAVTDIQGFLSDAGRVELAKTLLRAGLIEVVALNQVTNA